MVNYLEIKARREALCQKKEESISIPTHAYEGVELKIKKLTPTELSELRARCMVSGELNTPKMNLDLVIECLVEPRLLSGALQDELGVQDAYEAFDCFFDNVDFSYLLRAVNTLNFDNEVEDFLLYQKK